MTIPVKIVKWNGGRGASVHLGWFRSHQMGVDVFDDFLDVSHFFGDVVFN